MTSPEGSPEAARLEQLWAEEFGNEYLERNIDAGEGRDRFWYELLDRLKPQSVLEIGCNVGANLRWVVDRVPARAVYGIDINEPALRTVRSRFNVNAVWSSARELPFRDRMFDLVFTAGVLIHQPETTLSHVMGEAVRTSRRDVLALEYAAAETVEVPYRGQPGALYKRDYGRLYKESFAELDLVDEGELSKEEGWDNVTWWLFRRNS